jgi:hypothetical protein
MNKITASTQGGRSDFGDAPDLAEGSVLDHRTAGGSHHEQETTEQFTE